MMLSERTLNIREANLDEDTLIDKHFYQLWRDNNVPEHCIRSNWLEVLGKPLYCSLGFVESNEIRLDLL